MNQDNLKEKEQPFFFSKHAHKYKEPIPDDDLESLVYTLLYLSKVGLPWENIKCPPARYSNEIFLMKNNFDYYSWCGDEFEFLADILEFLKIKTKKNDELKYEIIKKLLNNENLYESNGKIKTKYHFCFIKEILDQVKISYRNNENERGAEKIKELFKGYQIDFINFCNEIK